MSLSTLPRSMSKSRRRNDLGLAGRTRKWLREKRRPWDRHFKIIDPMLAAVCGLFIVWAVVVRDRSFSRELVEREADILFTAGSAVPGTMLGLSVAAVAIIADHIGKPHITTRLSQEHKENLVGTFVSSIRWLGTGTLLALAGLIVSGTSALQVLLGAWLLSTVMASGYLVRAISLLRVIVFAAVATDGSARQ